MKYLIILGTRPEIIKFSPIVNHLAARKCDYLVVWLGQNPNLKMGAQVFEEFGYDRQYIFKWKNSYSMKSLQALAKTADIVLVQGDTTSAAIGAVAAVSEKVTLAHIEAGLRSNDMGMREERNRRSIDVISDLLFCPVETNIVNLILENCFGKKFLTGNTIADVLFGIRKPKNQQNKIVCTFHRPELVDNPDLFRDVLTAIDNIKGDLPVIFPVHPRTRGCLKYVPYQPDFDYIDPVPAREMWNLIQDAKVVFTDSGGIQEECCILGVPCITVRNNTERPETVKLGANILVSPDKSVEEITDTVNSHVWELGWEHPYGRNVAKKIIEVCDELA